MLKTVFFDLDGTLLPMDQEEFIRQYLACLTSAMEPEGYDPETLGKAVWTGTKAMVCNDGSKTNEAVFWESFSRSLGRNAREEEQTFLRFYQGPFQQLRAVCGYNPAAASAVREIRNLGLNTVLATNPLFPAVATQSRVRWAGLEPEDFAWLTTYENSRYCKPNPDYYREILDKLNLKPGECLMVGNDVQEDGAAAKLGMPVFLLTDCLIQRGGNADPSWPQGSFPELLGWIRSELGV